MNFTKSILKVKESDDKRALFNRCFIIIIIIIIMETLFNNFVIYYIYTIVNLTN